MKKSLIKTVNLKRIILMLGIFFSLFLVFHFYDSKENKSLSSYQLGISSDYLDSFQVTKNQLSNSVRVIKAHKYDIVLELKIHKNISLNQSKDTIANQIYMLKTLYRDLSSPYPGALSNEIFCDDKYKIKTIENQPFNYYTLFASERFNFGVCTPDLIKYRSIIYYHYCNSNQNLYEMQFFFPLSKDINDDVINGIKCESDEQ